MRFFFFVGLVLCSAFSTSHAQDQGNQNTVPVGGYRDVVKKVLPAVVSIDVRETKQQSRTNDMLEGESKQFDPRRPRGNTLPFGSGVIIDTKGIVITNHHVIEGAEVVEVTLQDGRTFKANSSQIKSDPKTDLAIIRINTRGSTIPAMEFGSSKNAEIGDPVLALGAPFGLKGSVTQGIISAKGRSLNPSHYEDFIQTDAAVNPGNSGGPLVNLEGKLIGINTAIQTATGTFSGVSLAVPSDMVKDVADHLQKFGRVKRAELGAILIEVNHIKAELLGVKSGAGVGVCDMQENSIAKKAKLEDGDVIIGLGNQDVRDVNTLKSLMSKVEFGKETQVKVVRQKKVIELPIVIDETPETRTTISTTNTGRPRGQRQITLPDFDNTRVIRIGLEVTEMTADLNTRLRLKAPIGSLLVTVVEDKGYSKGVIDPFTVLLQVNGEKLTSVEQLNKVLLKADLEKGVIFLVRNRFGATFEVVREGE